MAGRKPGTPKTGGRQKGTPNKATVAVKDALDQAFNGLGGTDALVKWGKENPNLFYPLWIKLLPTQITGKDGGPIETSNLTPEQKAARVLELLSAAKERAAA